MICSVIQGLTLFVDYLLDTGGPKNPHQQECLFDWVRILGKKCNWML